ncbi:MAG: hypothetical protein Q8L81_12670 [Bacteroidota bacterium]|nr:hypothetical protein [Bacteroidota bacterium]
MRADGVEMLKYTFQHLVMEGHVEIYYRAIQLTKNDWRKRPRIFFKLGNEYKETNTYSVAEQFVIDILKTKEELRIHEIKNKVLELLDKDIRNFKYDYVYKDVTKLGLCTFKYFLNSKGREVRRYYKNVIDVLEEDVNMLVKNKLVLEVHLGYIKTGIILLDDEVVKKFGLKVPDLDELSAAFEIIITGGGNRITYGGFGYGGYSGGGGGGGFSGFGGGMSGGGGSGGSW